MLKILYSALLTFLKEPLFHFMLLGAMIFWIFDGISDGQSGDRNSIMVAPAKIENLKNIFMRTWQRQPSEAELDGLIQDYIREEVAVREAIELGLDRDDSIMRRLLRQKLEFVTEEAALQVEPTDAQLQQYLDSHAEVFSSEPSVSFSQIYFKPQQPGARRKSDIAVLRDRLNANKESLDASTLGDITSLQHDFDNVPSSQIGRLFGEQFADGLNGLQPGQWAGPLNSGYGQHLVRVARYTPNIMPDLPQVRDAVRWEWLNSRRANALDQFYARRLQHYNVTIDMPATKKDIHHMAEWVP